MPVYKKRGRKFYTYDFTYRGSRFSGSTGCEDKREAKRYEAAVRKQAKESLADRGKPMTFAVASSLYWEEKGQYRADKDDLERYLAWLQNQIGRNKLIADISDRDVAAAVAKRRGENVKPATVNRSVTVPLRSILKRASKTWKQHVQEIEWGDHMLEEPQERVREASADEERKLMAQIRGDYAPALRFAILSGCRREEIVGLQWQHVDFFNRQFTVTGKRDKSRTVPMTQALYDLLWSQKDFHPAAVFTYEAQRQRKGVSKGSRQPITIEGFKTEWRRSRAKTGVMDFRFHDSRHTAATRLVRATGNIKLAQRLLGHTDIATTTKYAHVVMEDLRAGMEAANHTQIHTPDRVAASNELETNGKSAKNQ